MKIRKYQNSGDLPYMPADNTAVAWNPQRKETIVARQYTPTQELDITDNPMGYAPVVGDILQGGQAIIDFSNGDWKKGALNLALLAVPNVIERPVKAGIKALKQIPRNEIKRAARKGARDADRFLTSDPTRASIQRNIDLFLKNKEKYKNIDWSPISQDEIETASFYSPRIKVKNLGTKRGESKVAVDDNGRFLISMKESIPNGGNEIIVNLDHTASSARSTGFHERLHVLGYGDASSNPVNSELGLSLFKPETDMHSQAAVDYMRYLKEPHETAAWLAQTGYELGLRSGTPYPGVDGVKKFIEKNKNQTRLNYLLNFLKLDSEENYKKLWKGLTGTLYTGIVVSTLNSENYAPNGLY